MQPQNIIQTTHGVSYPLVGIDRMEQSELLDENNDEEPLESTDVGSQPDA